MKPRMLVLALVAAFGSGCTSMDKPKTALRVEPVMSIRHGAPDAQSYYQLGRYYQGQKRLEQAEVAYLRAVAVDDHNVDVFNALGSLYAERGELERSAEMFQRATAMAPDAAYLYNNLGFAYYLQGRLDEAYTAVLRALNLDEKLERAWVNLEQIAGARSVTGIIEVVKARRLDALPTGLALNSPPAETAAKATQTAGNQSLSQNPEVALELPTQETQTDVGRMQLAKSEDTPTVVVAPAKSSSSGIIHPMNDVPPVQKDTNQIQGGRFVLVSANRELASNGGAIEIYAANAADAHVKNERQTPLTAVRIEVSNANGVGGFARKFSSQLRSNNLLVTRITNHRSYSVSKTNIQYDPRYEDAARTLMSQFNLTGRIVPARTARAGADIRIVLGRDALQSRWQPNPFRNATDI